MMVLMIGAATTPSLYLRQVYLFAPCDMLLASVTIILKPVGYNGSRFTWSACSLSIRISNNSSTMNMSLPENSDIFTVQIISTSDLIEL